MKVKEFIIDGKGVKVFTLALENHYGMVSGIDYKGKTYLGLESYDSVNVLEVSRLAFEYLLKGSEISKTYLSESMVKVFIKEIEQYLL